MLSCNFRVRCWSCAVVAFLVRCCFDALTIPADSLLPSRATRFRRRCATLFLRLDLSPSARHFWLAFEFSKLFWIRSPTIFSLQPVVGSWVAPAADFAVKIPNRSSNFPNGFLVPSVALSFLPMFIDACLVDFYLLSSAVKGPSPFSRALWLYSRLHPFLAGHQRVHPFWFALRVCNIFIRPLSTSLQRGSSCFSTKGFLSEELHNFFLFCLFLRLSWLDRLLTQQFASSKHQEHQRKTRIYLEKIQSIVLVDSELTTLHDVDQVSAELMEFDRIWSHLANECGHCGLLENSNEQVWWNFEGSIHRMA